MTILARGASHKFQYWSQEQMKEYSVSALVVDNCKLQWCDSLWRALYICATGVSM